MLSTQPYKGARDFYPEDKRLQKYLFEKMRSVVERYGYEEYDAPLIESLELYASKSGEELVNEQTYVFEDRGGRTVTIRPEMTPSVSRMVAARRQELAYPLRWYSIPNLWRYERPQRGRLREHWQLNVDIFGVAGLEADHEIIEVADSIMQSFGANRSMYLIKVNSRQFVDFMLGQFLGIPKDKTKAVIGLIDKMHKLTGDDFAKQLKTIINNDELVKELIELLHVDDITKLPLPLRSQSSLANLELLLNLLKKGGIDNVVFDISLMRGFDYYTDIVFEVYDTEPSNNRSMFGGGRYDGLVELFGVESLPTVGFGMGDVVLKDFLESHSLLPKLDTEADAYVVLIGDVYARALPIIAELRSNGLNIALDSSGRKPALQIKSAVKKGIAYAIFIGEEELKTKAFILRNLSGGSEEKHNLNQLINKLKA